MPGVVPLGQSQCKMLAERNGQEGTEVTTVTRSLLAPADITSCILA